MDDDDLMMDRFQAHPDSLADASKAVLECGDSLDRARADASMLPPSEAFGLLPESAALAAALARSVQAALDDLDNAVDSASAIGGGLADCAQNYTELDGVAARQIRNTIA